MVPFIIGSLMTVRKILAIDGGGIMGVMPASFLAELEKASGKSITDHFDLIVGTSTGGIIALCLGLGSSAAEIESFYLNDGPQIFDSVGNITKWQQLKKILRHLYKSKYSPSELKKALVKVLGQKKLGESKCRLVIPSYDFIDRKVNLFKTAHHERFATDYKREAVDIALATAAAPTYFPIHQAGWGQLLIDGGIWANNPVGVAVVEAIGVLGWKGEDLRVLSVGCTDPLLEIALDSGLLNLREKAISLITQAQMSGSLATAQILTAHSETNPRVYRRNVTVPEKAFGIDEVKQSITLQGIGKAEARKFQSVFKEIFLDSTVEAFEPFHTEG